MAGDEGTLDRKIPKPAFKTVAAHCLDANSVKSALTFLISKSRKKENVTRRRLKYDTAQKCDYPPLPKKKVILMQV